MFKVLRRRRVTSAPTPADETGDQAPGRPPEPTSDRAPTGPTELTDPTPRPDRLELWQQRVTRLAESRIPLAAWFVIIAAGLAALVAAMVPVGPSWLGGAGAVAVVSAYSWSLAARTGGRPVVFGSLALAIGVSALVLDSDELRTGAAVMTCVVAAVFAVMATVPAATYLRAVRECMIAVLLAGIGAVASIGFEPVITVARFEYATFGLALAGVFGVVYRLGAGLHGLGRRGLVIVVVGALLLTVTLAYAELLRRYGTTELVATLLDTVHWSREHLGAFPRPIVAVLGIPALAYGCHMRARRRQGWWICAFGVTATSAVGNSLANPGIAFSESALSVGYGLVLGLMIAFVVIRLDSLLTGGGSSRGRRSRTSERASAMRPEPARGSALL